MIVPMQFTNSDKKNHLKLNMIFLFDIYICLWIIYGTKISCLLYCRLLKGLIGT